MLSEHNPYKKLFEHKFWHKYKQYIILVYTGQIVSVICVLKKVAFE